MPVKQAIGGNPYFATSGRWRIFSAVVILVAAVFVLKLVHLQIIEAGLYKKESESQAIKQMIIEPFRGNMYDRNGTLIVHNEPSFSVRLTPNDFRLESLPLLLSIIPADTMEIIRSMSVLYSETTFEEKVVPELREMLAIDTAKIIKRSANVGFYTRFTPIKIYRDADFSEISLLEEFNDYLSGIDVIVESKRLYQFEGNMAHILGYTREISRKELDRMQYYRPGDIIGKRGLEKSYEDMLRGQEGIRFIAVNSAGRKISSFEKGRNDIKSRNGFDLYLSIDHVLQKKAEDLMKNKRGAIVALDPNTGGIICFASSPDYDPRAFTGKISTEDYNGIINDPGIPMLNRVIQTRYPPGSTWKMLIAIAALQENFIDKNTRFHCPGGMKLGRRFFKCHGAHGSINVTTAIQASCNTFFYQLGLKMGMEPFEKYGKMFGFGQHTNIDIPGEKKGILPTMEWLEGNKWTGGFTRGKLLNYGIGQGEILVTPLQLAVYTAAIANGGTMHQPHFVDEVYNNMSNRFETPDYQSKKLPIDKDVFEIVREGMYRVVNRGGGTALIARIPGKGVCGKTGTAQNPHGKDHAWFTCFAPKEKPEIVVTVLVENAGFGSTHAAPVARDLLYTHFYPDSLRKHSAPKDTLENQIIPPDSNIFENPEFVEFSE